MKSRRFNKLLIFLNILSALLIICAFVFYSLYNRSSIRKQTETFMLESNMLVAEELDNKIMSGFNYAETLAQLLSDSLVSSTVPETELSSFMSDSIFDMVEYCDADGIEHTLDGVNFDASEREYYLEGMQGHTGMVPIFNSYMLQENLIVYYAPIRFDERTTGVLLGINKAADHVSESFKISYSDITPDFYLCTPDGRVIASNQPLDVSQALYADDLSDGSDEARADILNAIETGESVLLHKTSLADICCITTMKNSGWHLIQFFPHESFKKMVASANLSGGLLAAVMLIAFVIAASSTAAVFKREHEYKEKVSNDLGMYQTAMLSEASIVLKANLTANQLLEGTWKNNNGILPLPDILGLNLPCSYDNYIELWNLKYVDERFRDQFKLKTSRRYLIQAFESNKHEVTFDYEGLSIDGKHLYMRRLIVMTRNEKTGDILAYTNVKDVSELIMSEMKQKQDLEDALHNAQKADRAKSIFLSNMSHDIRTPMNAIIGFTSLAEMHLDDREAVKTYLSKISYSSKYLLSLINDVLDMSRIESGKMHLEPVETNLPEVMKELRNILLPDIKNKGLAFSLTAADVIHENVLCDKMRLNQVLINLTNNAIKYTQTGGTVSITLVEHPGDDKDTAIYDFHIKDSGIGMSKEFLEHIFEPFERERNTTISKIQGTGLGMSITKSIVDMMNGSITVTSQIGIGSEFIVSLPIRLVNVSSENSYSTENLKNRHVLIVDDNITSCESASSLLKRAGMHVEWTPEPEDVLSMAKKAAEEGDPYEVYIVDWMMPTMNGIQLTKQLRETFGKQPIIIVFSSYEWGDIQEEARQAGVDGHIGKPLFMTDLCKCLDQTLHSSEANNPKTSISCDDLTGQRILLVEDNELNREIANDILSEAGLIVEEAENGRIGVDKLVEKGAGYYSLVLMDIQMPEMDGYEAARAIRALRNKTLANIPIIAMTANAFVEDRQKAFEAGMNAHIPKPFSIDLLLKTLREMI